MTARRPARTAGAIVLHLLIAELLGGLGIVQALQRAVVALGVSGLVGYAPRNVQEVGRGNGPRVHTLYAAVLRRRAAERLRVVQSPRFNLRLTPSAISVQTTPDSRYTVTATGPKRADTPSATSGASAAPISQARSVVIAAPV
jgi:hypothetical protein